MKQLNNPGETIDWKAILHNQFLQHYLHMVEDTESPRLMHIWSALTGVSACLARRCWFTFGANLQIFPNQYVFLVGQAGVRKSTAINLTVSMLRALPSIKFAPEDIAGQHRNLIDAMIPSEALSTPQDFANLVIDQTSLAQPVFMQASELATILGYGQMDLITFLTKLWDGEDYTYANGKVRKKLINPLGTLIGGTTPVLLSNILPTQSLGQGFLSRIILVYARHKYKTVQRPQPLDVAQRTKFQTQFYHITQLSGQFKEEAAAATALDKLYGMKLPIYDPRFVGYRERRHIHLIKLAMQLAAAELRMTITEADIADAQNILQFTEVGMGEALGEFGLSPIAHARQKLLEFLQACDEPIHMSVLWAAMRKDMKQSDFVLTLEEFEHDGKITKVTAGKSVAYLYRDPRVEVRQTASSLLAP